MFCSPHFGLRAGGASISPLPLPSHLQGRVWRGSELLAAHALTNTSSTGFALLDAELPGRGWPRQGLIEIGVPEGFHCEWRLLQPALQSCVQSPSHVYLVTPPAALQAAGVAALGPFWRSVVGLHAPRLADALWLVEQVLQAQADGIVMLWIPHLRNDQVRRLHTKAEAGGLPVFWFRPIKSGSSGVATPAPLRLWIEPHDPWHLAVRILKRRAQPCEKTLLIRALPAGVKDALPLPREQVLAARVQGDSMQGDVHGWPLGRTEVQSTERRVLTA
ncbi:translesion DNA synthesis-associated protein ImuA [Acidovorax lacteus]|uniref:translesion DNA synthesis-associated protein ImuA n=1 Tax=Acidovorax lacteus TaxID=1924988 RepID=UPI0031F12151